MNSPSAFRRVRSRMFGVLALATVWVLLWGTLSIGNVLSGIAVGLAVVLLFPLPRIPIRGRFHLTSFIALNFVIATMLVRATLQVTWITLRPGPPPKCAILKRRLSVQSDIVLTLIVDALSLIPGSLVLQVDKVQRVVFIHVLDVSDKRAIADFHRNTDQLERWFIRAFERPEDWQNRSVADADSPTSPEGRQGGDNS
ncbi:Na+/H+ antiporter subunit E [Hoyosella rhizosphaerae]|uniref:Cation antiporter subunit n=1 Tax=Hoyosella rhizosphaerae TaxID=1755582 RepID=A0A916U635_9ACTN|nr:Na+/H+ antiporter subunit E [Hoyosella rhizosphaerae]MBN4927780.1 Na+/H+ antiporter subunit E [Hoyosella rhizosphaerae]GGC61595.1 putative cation antiporter subunit [Hoyosella rhizosphaerae]